MKGHRHEWTDEQLAWIKSNRKLVRKVAYELFCEVFNCSDITYGAYVSLCKRKGWTTGRTGRFEKGQEPANKGRKMPYNENSARTQFKKGDRKGRAHENYKPIGYERISRDGYLERKINDDLPLQSRWRAVHLLNWENKNGPIPEGHCLKCLDGNKANTNPENWICVSRSLLPRLAGRWSLSYDEAPGELKPTILALAHLENAARGARSKK